MIASKSHNIWLIILTSLITVMMPFLIYGTVNLIQNDLRVRVMWSAGYVDENRINELMQLLNAQNEILRVGLVNEKEDIIEIKADLRVINNRIDRLTNTTRSLHIDSKKDDRDIASLEQIMKKWR